MFPFGEFCVILSGNWSRRLVVQDAWFSSRKSRVRLPPGLPTRYLWFLPKFFCWCVGFEPAEGITAPAIATV